jgi:hypothetical protein
MNMELFDFMQLLTAAIIKGKEERLWSQWLVSFGRMREDNFISYEEYCELASGEKEEKKSNNVKLNKEEILEEAERIKNLDQGRR